MPPDPSDAASLHDMIKAAETVIQYVLNKTREEYEREQILRDAVERRIEIIGEAARRLSKTFQDSHPEIPWRKVMATRHVLAHDYDEVDNNIVWQIATVYVPELLQQISQLVPPPPPDPEPE